MSGEEKERFIRCFGNPGEKCGWDIRAIAGEYQNLPLDEALDAFSRDLAHYARNCDSDKPDLHEHISGKTSGRNTIYLPYQESEYLN